jgi:hemoglobin/transferrin/lactoferrin receptor protein
LSSIPPLFGQFEVTYRAYKIELGAAIRFNSQKDVEDFNLTEGIDNLDLTPVVAKNAVDERIKYYGTPSWITMGLNANYIVSNNISMQARLDNLLDQHFIEFASGVASPGRNVSLSFRANF